MGYMEEIVFTRFYLQPTYALAVNRGAACDSPATHFLAPDAGSGSRALKAAGQDVQKPLAQFQQVFEFGSPIISQRFVKIWLCPRKRVLSFLNNACVHCSILRRKVDVYKKCAGFSGLVLSKVSVSW